MTLTKEIIEREMRIWERNGYIEGTVWARHYIDLCRLALLGLEREESRARVEAAAEADTHVELSVLDDSFGAFPDLGLGPDLDLGPEPHEAFLTEERDRERAERVGRAVLSLEGDETPRDLRSRAKQAERFGYDSYGGLLRAIADAMEEP